jgi:hypothetical protein
MPKPLSLRMHARRIRNEIECASVGMGQPVIAQNAQGERLRIIAVKERKGFLIVKALNTGRWFQAAEVEGMFRDKRLKP